MSRQPIPKEGERPRWLYSRAQPKKLVTPLIEGGERERSDPESSRGEGIESIRSTPATGGEGSRGRRVHPVDLSDRRRRIRVEPIQSRGGSGGRGRDAWCTSNFSPLLQSRNHGIVLLETDMLPFKLAIMAYYHAFIHSGLLSFLHLLNAW